jgi:hypothetical protein
MGRRINIESYDPTNYAVAAAVLRPVRLAPAMSQPKARTHDRRKARRLSSIKVVELISAEGQPRSLRSAAPPSTGFSGQQYPQSHKTCRYRPSDKYHHDFTTGCEHVSPLTRGP